MTEAPPLETLHQVSDGLLFQSETDAPLVPFFWPSDEADLTPELFRQLSQTPQNASIKTVKIESFFRNATKAEDWHNDQEKAEVERFKQLVKTLKATLKEVQVFRVGKTAVDVYIVGKCTGGYAGLQTKVVET